MEIVNNCNLFQFKKQIKFKMGTDTQLSVLIGDLLQQTLQKA